MSKYTGSSPYHATDTHMECYVVYLHNEGIKAETIRSHLTAIGNKMKLKGLTPNIESFKLKKLITAYGRTDNPPTMRKPITARLLKNMIVSIRNSGRLEHTKRALTSMFTMMYAGLLRVSEVSRSKGKANNHNIHRGNVTVNHKKREVVIKLDTYKFSKKPVTMAITEEGNISPYTNLLQYDSSAGNRKWLYEDRNGKPYIQDAIRRMLVGVLEASGVKATEYNTHSFRIGKATDMWKQGYTDMQICLAGRWNSKAYKKYIKPQILRFG